MYNTNFSLEDFNIDLEKDFLGRGKFGYVYKAYCKKLNTNMALKIININNNDKNQLISVKREYEIMKKVDNPNIEKIFGSFKGINPVDKKDCYFFVLEFIEGTNLDKLMREYQLNQKHIDQNLIMKIFFGIENGLYYLHKNGIIHRDISPDNIMMMNKDNQIKITDFGLSAYYVEFEMMPKHLKFNYSIVGRRLYVGIEVLKRMNSKDNTILYDIKSDIFAFGVTMYYLMAFGYPLCVQDRVKDKENFTFVNEISPKIYTKNLINLVMLMLQDDQNKRPTCLEIFERLVKINKINSTFLSVINCFAISEELYKYLIDTENVKNSKLKNKGYEFNKLFLDALKESKLYKNSKSPCINQFINCFYDKIIIYDMDEDIHPINIIKSIFDYFLSHFPHVFNNKKAQDFEANKIYEPLRENKFIDHKILEFKQFYSNIFAKIFYFLVLRTYKCTKCNEQITQDLEIKYCLDLMKYEKGNNRIYKVSELMKEFFKKKNYLNLGINTGGYSLTCQKCGMIPKFLDQYDEIILEPDILILNFLNEVKLEKYLTINGDKYDLKAIIVDNMKTMRAYEFGIHSKEDDWIYFNNGHSKIMIFEELEKMRGIKIAFYSLSNNKNNEFSIFANI